MKKDETNQKSSTDPQREKSSLIDVLINHYEFPPRTAVLIVQRASRSVEKIPQYLIKSGNARSWLLAKLVAKAAQLNIRKIRKDLAVELSSHPVSDRRKILFEKVLSVFPAYALGDLPDDPERLQSVYLRDQKAIIRLNKFLQELEVKRTNLIALVPSLPAKRNAIKNAIKEGVLLPGTKWKTVGWEPLKKVPICNLFSVSYYTPAENEALEKIEEVETKIAAVRIVLEEYVEQKQRIRVRAKISDISLAEYLPETKISSDKRITLVPTPLPNEFASAGATQLPNGNRLHSLKGLDWGEVSISVSGESITIRARGITEVKHFSDFGCRDTRSKADIKPDKAWITLRALASENGDIAWTSDNIPEKVRHSLQKQIQALRPKLKKAAGINSDPFHPYTKDGGYKTKFSIRMETAIDHTQNIRSNNERDDSEIEELMKSEIHRGVQMDFGDHEDEN